MKDIIFSYFYNFRQDELLLRWPGACQGVPEGEGVRLLRHVQPGGRRQRPGARKDRAHQGF